jgi:CubicO group peptidase (beta-lactamase class C family)
MSLARAGAIALVLVGCGRELSPPELPMIQPALSAPAPRWIADGPEEEERRARIAATRPRVVEQLRADVARHHLPHLSLGVVFHGSPVYTVSFGAVDARRPVDPATLYRIGSVTKTLTGLALLKLRDEGRLSLDDPAARYMPEFGSVTYPTSDSPRITLRHLVTHTSGLPRLGSMRYGDGRRVLRDDVRRAVAEARLEFVPGMKSVYSNLGVAAAGLVIERVTGEPYRVYMTREVLRPIGMHDAVWDAEAVPAGRLAPCFQRAGDEYVPCDGIWHLDAAEAMGGLFASTRDLASYAAFELSAWPPRDGPELGPVRRSSVRESHLVAGFARPGKSAPGVSWFVRADPLGMIATHNGATEGYSASVWLLPDRSIGVVALSPITSELDRITKRVLAVVAAEKAAP